MEVSNKKLLVKKDEILKIGLVPCGMQIRSYVCI